MSLSGTQRRQMPHRLLKIAQICTGYLLVRWLVWLVARYLFGYRVTSTLSLAESKIVYKAQTTLLGRPIRNVEEVYLVSDVVSLGVERRFPHLLLLTGALGLIVGAVYGVTAVIDGIQASYLAISLVGFGILTAGVLFDIGLGSLAGFIGDQSSLLVTVNQSKWGWLGSRFRITGVDEKAAREFVQLVVAPE